VQTHNLKLTADHLRVAKWNVEQVKKAIAVAGQVKIKNGDKLFCLGKFVTEALFKKPARSVPNHDRL
jgi:hypothetical protein